MKYAMFLGGPLRGQTLEGNYVDLPVYHHQSPRSTYDVQFNENATKPKLNKDGIHDYIRWSLRDTNGADYIIFVHNSIKSPLAYLLSEYSINCAGEKEFS